jgi:hypothetical protein
VIPHGSDDLCGIYIFGRRIDLRRDYVVAALRTILISVRDAVRNDSKRLPRSGTGPFGSHETKSLLRHSQFRDRDVGGQRRWSPEPGPDGDLAARSRGTSISTWPVVSVNTRFARVPRYRCHRSTRARKASSLVVVSAGAMT